MKTKKVDEAVALSKLMYLREHQKIHALLAEEGRLAAGLKQLEEQDRQAFEASSQLTSYYQLGADTKWLSWSSQTRAALNSELAQARAKRFSAMTKVSYAAGRYDAVSKIGMDLRRKAKAKRNCKQLEALYQLASSKK